MMGHAGMGWGAGAHEGASSGAIAAFGAVAGACCEAVLVECRHWQGKIPLDPSAFNWRSRSHIWDHTIGRHLDWLETHMQTAMGFSIHVSAYSTMEAWHLGSLCCRCYKCACSRVSQAGHLRHAQGWRRGRSASLLQQDHDVVVHLHQVAQRAAFRVVGQVAPSQECRHRVLLWRKRMLGCMHSERIFSL